MVRAKDAYGCGEMTRGRNDRVVVTVPKNWWRRCMGMGWGVGAAG